MPIKHSLQTAIHKPYAAVYADAVARLAATGFVRAEGGGTVPFDATDIYKKVLQVDDTSEWILTAITPTWVQVSGAGSLTNDSITNALLANMAQGTIKGRASGAGTGDPTDLTATQATAIMNAVVGDSGSGGTKGLVPAPGAGDAAAGKFLKADGTFAVPPLGTGDVVGPSSATDHAVARFDTTTGKLIQDSVVIVSDAGAFTVPEIAAPSTPAAGTVHIYAKSDGKLYIKDDTGAETDLTGGGGSIAPLVIEGANEVAQRNGVNAQSFLLYGTFTDASNYERLSVARSGSNFVIGTEAAGSGSVRQLQLGFGATRRLHFSAGEFTPDANNVLDLGSGSLRWASVRAVNSWAQTAFIFENGTQITDAGATNGGVVKFSSLISGPGTFTGGSGSPSAIGSNQNDYNFVTLSYFQRWSSSTAVDITGMTRFQQDGQVHVIVNVGSNNITLKHEDAASTAANRFLNSTGADIVLSANQAADVIYDATTQRWRAFKRN